MRLSSRFLLIALLAIPFSACDETGGKVEDVDVALEDAVAARQSGNLQQAVTLLEEALVLEPSNPKVRVELATTLLQQDDIDLLDLNQIGEFVTTATGTRHGTTQARHGSCAVASDPTAKVFDPTAFSGFDNLVRHLQTLKRASELLSPVIPASLQGFDICTSIVDGQFAYDRTGAISALRAQGLTETQVAQALAVNALNKFLEAYLFITTEVNQTATWYRKADGSIVICVDDEDAFETQVRSAVTGLGEAVLSLDARASILGSSSVAAEIVDVVLDAYETARDGIADFCD